MTAQSDTWELNVFVHDISENVDSVTMGVFDSNGDGVGAGDPTTQDRPVPDTNTVSWIATATWHIPLNKIGVGDTYKICLSMGEGTPSCQSFTHKDTQTSTASFSPTTGG